jgi:hypothetical protein
MLSGCLFIPAPIGVVYPTAYPVASREEAMAPPSTPLATNPNGKLAAKKERQETAKKRQRVECKEQAELLSDADRQAYAKECMSEER